MSDMEENQHGSGVFQLTCRLQSRSHCIPGVLTVKQPEAAQTLNAVTHAWYQITFGQSFGSAPRFLAALATYDGADSAHLRYSRTSLSDAIFYIFRRLNRASEEYAGRGRIYRA